MMGRMAASGGPIEVEWQFNAVDVRPVARWLDNATVEGFTMARTGIRRLNDAYFDTDNWRLHRSGYTCRLRWEGSKGELTLKAMADAVDGIRRREEINQPVADPSPLKFLVEPGVATAILAPLIGTRPLRLLFVLETERQLYSLHDDAGVLGEIALDTTTIPVGNEDHPVRMSRIEVEIDGQAEARARRFVDILAASTALSRAGASKFEAALLATGQQPDEAVPDLGPTDIYDSMSASELAFAVMRRNFAALLQNEPGTRLGRDPEALHDMRVATRRIRAATSTFRAYLSPTALGARDEIGWLTRILGPVRDLDVQIERLEARMAQPDVGDEGLNPYLDLLQTRREAARKRMLAALDSRRYERAVGRWVAILQRGPARTFLPGRTPAVAAATELVGKRYRRLRKRADGIAKDSPAEEYHASRIEAKKLRYAAEFVAPLYGGRAEGFIAAVKGLQDVLGDHQDAAVAMETLRAEGGNRRLPASTLLAMGALIEHYRIDAARLRGEFPAAYRRVRGKTWRGFAKRMKSRAARADPPVAPARAPVRAQQVGAARPDGGAVRIDRPPASS